MLSLRKTVSILNGKYKTSYLAARLNNTRRNMAINNSTDEMDIKAASEAGTIAFQTDEGKGTTSQSIAPTYRIVRRGFS